MKLQTLQDLFVEEIRDLYNAEQQVAKALPKMEKAAHSPELQNAYRMHLDQTKNQVERLKQIFGDLKLPVRGKTCKGMEGIISEGEELLKEDADPDVRDAGLIASAQKVEHYEISSYGTARTYAKQLGYTNAARLLQQTLEEERQTDEKLTSLAERSINPRATSQQK